ncbi:MAG TPA: sigma-70 family RNA polymerase sigma factor [Pirellulaceae bacterium]|nr:sigma-70 family RNA polymerase sigma factor [Pirellulaceae bacterium]HMO92319.1 sigma-70 family RNA polymerase sigma factor [Pirellulaceae bacterium]HMP69243.1 sigma-70 family RNA polymerase sigma factor [Pirellulaceae bacterium]
MGQAASNQTRASLLLKLRDKDEAAWLEFVQLYTSVVLSYALRRGLQTHDAEDLTQEVMVEVAHSIQKFEYQPDKGRFRDWFGMIVRRRLARFWRSGKNRPACAEDLESEGNPDAQWIDEFQGVVLQAALENVRQHFADTTWQAFQAVWLDRTPAAEVAQRLNVPIEVVYNAKSRVLKQLESEVIRISDDCAWLPNR